MAQDCFGFFIGYPRKRVYQKVVGGKHYDQGTMFYIVNDNDTTDPTKLTAFTPLDATQWTAAHTVDTTTKNLPDLKYVGIVSAVDGVDAAAGASITLAADAEVDIDAYERYKAAIIAKTGSSTMGFPIENPGPQIIQGLGELRLTKKDL
jgi:hypothetical protein